MRAGVVRLAFALAGMKGPRTAAQFRGRAASSDQQSRGPGWGDEEEDEEEECCAVVAAGSVGGGNRVAVNRREKKCSKLQDAKGSTKLAGGGKPWSRVDEPPVKTQG